MDRKEAIEVIKKNYPHVGISGSEFETALRELVPELAESEDERIRKEIIDWMKGGNTYDWQENKEKWIAYLEKQKEQKHAEQLDGTFTSYDMAKTFTEGQNYVIAHPEKFGLCKPAEWSEEDERMLEPIISDLRELCNCETDEELISDYEDRIAWLKSLRPQHHWKPSKEQMDAMETIINSTHNPNHDICILRELYNDLKKL